MLAKRSPLKWHNFALLQSHFRFVDNRNEDGPVDVEALFESYPIDIDFALKEPEDGLRAVFVKVLVNWPDEGPVGYKLFVEAVGMFSITDEENLSKEIRSNLAHYSTVNMMLNRIRSHISEVTASSALGTFTLPGVDITDLFKQKAAKKEAAPKTPKAE